MKNLLMPVICAVVFLLVGIITGTAFTGSITDIENASEIKDDATLLSAEEVSEYPAETVDYDYLFVPNIVSDLWYGDTEAVWQILEMQKSGLLKNTVNAGTVSKKINEALMELGSFSRYYDYESELCIEVDGKKYGAYVEEGAPPIGGGKGYSEIFTTGDYVVRTLAELTDALSKAQSGEVVFIEGNAAIDITTLVIQGKYLELKEGVTLASNRGHTYEDGTVSTGGKIYSTSMANRALYAYDNSRVTGLIFAGGDPNQHLEHHYRAFSAPNAPGHSYYYSLTSVATDGIHVVGNNVTVDNCEIAGFGDAGVNLYIGVKNAVVKYCYIHHNQANGLGYGVCHWDDAESVIEYNLFNYNRHSIAGSGPADSYYTARYNVEMGESLSHMFDMHGGRDRGDGTNIAGKYVDMYNNTFLSPMNPYYMRGVPVEYQNFYHNIVLNPKRNYNYSFFTGENVKIYDNIFGIEKQTVVK